MTGKELHRIDNKDIDRILEFIKSVVEESGCKGLVIGMSGGLDSAVATKLCVDAIGPKKVTNIFMPSSITPPSDYILTSELCKQWGTDYKVVSIQPAVDTFTGMLFSNIEAPLERGNISARCRMIVLYNRAKKMDNLVVGTSNRSEYMMGYFTKFGDGASDVVPMIDLYKTQVWEVAEMIGIPREIIEKVPTAGLWEGQTDEDEMGISYRDLDRTLNGISFGMSDKEISDHTGVRPGKISEVREQVRKMEHKRVQAARPEIGFNDPESITAFRA